MRPRPPGATTARYSDMLNALGAEPRLRIMRVLLSAHPAGMVVGAIQKELGISASNLSHHLDKLKKPARSALWNPALSIPVKDFEFTDPKGARIRAALQTWRIRRHR